MKTLNNLATATQIINTLNNAVVNLPAVKTSFSSTDLWSIQRNRRVRTVRKVVFQ